MRKGNAKKVATWISNSNSTFTYAKITYELGIERNKLFMIMHVMKRWGIRFEEKYDPSGEWGGNEKVYTFTGVVTKEQDSAPLDKKTELWKLALSI